MTWLPLAFWLLAVLLAAGAIALAYGRAGSRDQIGDGEADRNEFTFWWERET